MHNTMFGDEKREYKGTLTVASFQCQSSCDSVYNDNANDMSSVVFYEAFELLDPLLHWVSVVAFSLRPHVHLWVALFNSKKGKETYYALTSMD